MRITLLGLSLLIFLSNSMSQELKPVILQGQFINCPKNELTVFIQNIPGIHTHDTIRLNDEGKFHLETYKIITPQEIAIQSPGFYLNTLFVAPGYDLTLKCDASDWQTTRRTLEITGIGEESNAFAAGFAFFEYDLNLQESSGKKFLRQLDRMIEVKDSIYHKYYKHRQSEEPYFEFFSEMIKLNIQFDKLLQLIQYALIQGYPAKQMERFVTGNFDNTILENFSNDDWLISESYRYLSAKFFRYKMIVEGKYDKELLKDDHYVFENLGKIYSGKTREYVYANNIRGRFFRARDLTELESKAKTVNPYLKSFQNRSYITYLEERYREKERELLVSQAGKPAPIFSLPDTTGVLHSLLDFRGKVVYLDLWASWCKPCRKEIPFLKEIYKEYQENDDVVFIGIAIRDLEDDWINAVIKDKPLWLQLNDVNQTVSRSYHANILPRYIIIDKEGNFADPDAPRPGEKMKVMEILNREISKN